MLRLLAVALLVLAALRVTGGALSGGVTESAPSGAVHVVESDDTLWAIARSLAPQQDPRRTTRQLAEQLGSTPLVAGQRVELVGGADTATLASPVAVDATGEGR